MMKLVTIEYRGRRSVAVVIARGYVALDILNEGNPRFTQRLLPSLTQYTLVCNTNDPAVGGPMAEIFSYPLQVTTSIKVGYGAECPPCRYAPEA